jgi:SnoaL-like domain
MAASRRGTSKRKASRKAGRKSTTKKSTAKKSRAKKSTARKSSKKKSTAKKRKPAKNARKRAPAAKPQPVLGGPFPVTTGAGLSPLEVAKQVVTLLREGRSGEVEQLWFDPAIESVEGVGASVAWRGKSAVLDKYRAWEADHDIHEMQVEGPWVGATGFAVKYRVDLSQRSTGQRHQMEEIGVYTVRDGKITREEFHFATGS